MKRLKILGVIPARISSNRFPRKLLVKILSKSILHWTYERSKQCNLLEEVIIATDSDEIYQEAVGFGAKVIMTSPEHRSGLDRIIEVDEIMPNYSHLVNIQADEPMIHPETIEGMINLFKEKSCEVASAASPLYHFKEFKDSNNVKVVLNKDSKALYFSRGLIPYQTEQNYSNEITLKHIGLYSYRTDILKKIKRFSVPEIEKKESLEQLRILYNGMDIYIHITKHRSMSVDCPEDIEKVKEELLKYTLK